MKRIAVIGLGQRVVHVLLAMEAAGRDLEVAGHANPVMAGP